MGSPKITDTKPNISMAEHKKTIKEYLKKPFQALFGKNIKEKKKHAETTIEKNKPLQTTPVEEISESFKNLKIEKQIEEVFLDEKEELKNFTKYPKVKDDSEDSGYTDKCSDSECEQDDKKSDAKNETEEKKTRKKQTIVLPRKPSKNSVKNFIPNVQPYPQIRQVNRQTFSGGQVIVNPDVQPPIDEVLKGVDINVQKFELKSCQEKEEDWHIAQWFINKREVDELAEELSRNDVHLTCDIGFGDAKSNPSVFLTPPRSENSLSPLSESHNSYHPTTDFTMSPDMYNSDYEKYQEIVPLEEYPSCVTDTLEEKVLDPSKPERASMTMKQFKDMQKEIANRFSKMDCCQENRKPCKEIFKEHLHRLNIDERKDLCLKVAELGLDDVYGVLQHILLSLSNDDKDEDIKLSLFMLICEKVLAVKHMLFVNEFGLNLLKAAVFRCHSRPLLTRYLVQCIRVVTRGDSYTSTKGHVFHEVDAAGDTVVSACARAGDAYAPALAELVRAEPTDHPLFDVHHVNADGYTALHVACMEHSAAAPRAHAVHVLLQHAGADLWRGDIKGGDTAVHVAVNSAGCLTLLLLLFRPLPRADWKKLAHAPNRSSVTPLEYARSAIKSSSRPNYPPEVLDFLKKCR